MVDLLSSVYSVFSLCVENVKYMHVTKILGLPFLSFSYPSAYIHDSLYFLYLYVVFLYKYTYTL